MDTLMETLKKQGDLAIIERLYLYGKINDDQYKELVKAIDMKHTEVKPTKSQKKAKKTQKVEEPSDEVYEK